MGIQVDTRQKVSGGVAVVVEGARALVRADYDTVGRWENQLEVWVLADV